MLLMGSFQLSTFCDSMKWQYQHEPEATGPGKAVAAAVPTTPKCKKPCAAITNQQERALRAGRSCARLHLTAQGTSVVFGTGGLKANNAAPDCYFPLAFGRLQKEPCWQCRGGPGVLWLDSSGTWALLLLRGWLAAPCHGRAQS